MLNLTGDHYLLRTPLYPIAYIDRCFSDQLNMAVQQQEFLYGLFVTSENLYNEYKKQLGENALTEKMYNSLQKYYTRASSRCTPYGNFAGCALGNISNNTEIQLINPLSNKEVCRLDMDLIYKFIELLYKDSIVRRQIRYFINTSMYSLSGKFHYVRYRFDGKRNYYLSEIESTPYLKEILSKCGVGATFNELTSVLNLCGFENEEIESYLNLIIDNQIIVGEIEPNISGEEPFSKLKRILKQYDGVEKYTTLLEYLINKLSNNNFSIENLNEVTAILKQADINTNVSTLYQCDVNTAVKNNHISKSVIDKIIQQVNDILSVSSIKMPVNENLENFKRKFVNRYEYQIMPLCEVLDSEYGIGYGGADNINKFISDIKIESTGSTPNPLISFVNKSINSDQPNVREIVITKADLLLNDNNQNDISDAYDLQQNLYIMGCLYGNSSDAIDSGEFKFWLKLIGGPSHSCLLSRFAHLDSNIESWIKQLTKTEEETLPKDTIYAEIIHLPQERLGNIAQRPVLREYEIPYLGNSGAEIDKQISFSDIYIRVEGNSIVLISKRLNKRIIPRLTNAHNYSALGNLPVYKFLCDLQYQNGFGGVNFERYISQNGNYSPRICYENLILKRASWKISKEEFNGQIKKIEKALSDLNTLRDKLQLPQRVLLQQGDNELVIDFNHKDSCKILLNYIEKYGLVSICEFPNDDELFIKGELGKYINEVIFPVTIDAGKKRASRLTDNNLLKITTPKSKRIFIPGDDWIFLKVYCNNNTSEELLTTAIPRLVKSLQKKKLVNNFFFIRYTDSDFHLRLRFRMTDKGAFSEIMNAINFSFNKQVKNKQIHKIQIDTYVREIERYGDETIEETEALFHNDSICVLGLLKFLENENDEEHRWRCCLLGIDALLNDFKLKLDQKINLLELLQKNYYVEFGGSKTLHHSLNDKYRDLKTSIFGLFKDKDNLPYLKHFAYRSLRNKVIIEKILSVQKTTNPIIGSYIHMFVNRLFKSDGRKYELVIYHLLYKFYFAQSAMQKKHVKVEKNSAI